MIRLVGLTALCALAASPALARLADDDASAPPARAAAHETKAKKDVIRLSKKGQAADRIDYSDPNDNPFMGVFIKDDSPRAASKAEVKAAPQPAH